MSSSSFNRPGAVDLSQLTQRAKQAAATQENGPRAVGGSYVVEVTEQSFEAETIRKSVKHPVVVELYSPRVATGQQLSDALIDIANASDGKFLLARLNVDAAPGIVQALGLQAVPTVIALINGIRLKNLPERKGPNGQLIFSAGAGDMNNLLQKLPDLVGRVERRVAKDSQVPSNVDLTAFDHYRANVEALRRINAVIKQYLDIDVTLSRDEVQSLADELRTLRR